MSDFPLAFLQTMSFLGQVQSSKQLTSTGQTDGHHDSTAAQADLGLHCLPITALVLLCVSKYTIRYLSVRYSDLILTKLYMRLKT